MSLLLDSEQSPGTPRAACALLCGPTGRDSLQTLQLRSPQYGVGWLCVWRSVAQ